MNEKKIFYKKYINTSLNQNNKYNQNDSTLKVDSFNIHKKEKSIDKNNLNINIKG
jgi:hypothetical protein